MLPAVDEFIDRIEEGVAVFVTPIPGLFEDDGAGGNDEV